MEDRFDFTQSAKKNLFYLLIGGIVLSLIGVYSVINSGHGHEEVSNALDSHASGVDHSEDNLHPEFHWYQRVYSNLWINVVYFLGISISAIFFVAIQYVAQAGWSAGILRIPLAIGRC